MSIKETVMNNQDIILCPHCQAELAVPPDVTHCLCWSCQSKIELVQDAGAPTETVAEADIDDEWEIVDVKKERHIALLLAGFACWALAAGLWRAPGLAAWMWMPLFVAAPVFCIAALFPKRTRLGFVVLAVTLLSAGGTIAPRVVELQKKSPGISRQRDARVASNDVVAEWDRIYNEIAALRAQRVRALSSEIRDRVRATNPRLQWRRTGTTTEPIVQFDLVNVSRHTLSEVLFRATVTAPDRPEPLLDTEFRHVLPSPLAPRERLGILTTPPEFQPLANMEDSGRVDLTLAVETINAKNPEGKTLAATFTEADAARMEALEEKLESL